MKERLTASKRESIRVALVAAAAVAAGVAAAILAGVPFAELDSRENVEVVTVAGLVILAAGVVVAGVILPRPKRQP